MVRLWLWLLPALALAEGCFSRLELHHVWLSPVDLPDFCLGRMCTSVCGPGMVLEGLALP